MRSTLLLATFLDIVLFVSASPFARDDPTDYPIGDPTQGFFVPNVTTTGAYPALYTLDGCWSDPLSTYRVLQYPISPSPGSVIGCVQACSQGAYNLVGLEKNGTECWCDNRTESPTETQDLIQCTGFCKDGSHAWCGRFNYMMRYKIGPRT